MEQAEPDSRIEARKLTEYLGVLATSSRFTDPSKEDKTDGIVLPTSFSATSIILFIAKYIIEGLLSGQGKRVLRELFGPSSSPDLRKLMKEAFASLLPRLQSVPRESNFQTDIDSALFALDNLYLFLAEHLTNPPPAGPGDRIASANEEVIHLTNALARLGVLGFHNYLAAVGCFLLVLVERADIDGPAEMKNACRQLQAGIEHAEKTLLEWRHWSNSRLGVRSTAFVQGEPTITLITLDGSRYSAPGVRGWYGVSDEEEARFRRELLLAEDLVWEDVRSQYDLQQADGVLQNWRDLRTAWIELGFCG
jgi:hypothetical protein